MPSHPDRVRIFNCKKHKYYFVDALRRIAHNKTIFRFYECKFCGDIKSRSEIELIMQQNQKHDSQ